MKSFGRLTIFLLATSVLSVAAQVTSTGKWTIETFVDYGFIDANVVYSTVGGKPITLDVYQPKSSVRTIRPTLIFIHGGGWRRGSKEMYSLRVLPWLEKGWNVVNVEYRLTPEALAPAAVEDCHCALQWIYRNATKYGVDLEKIVVSGQSAGGHLALMTGLAGKENLFDRSCPGSMPRVSAVINWFGITEVGDLLTGKNKMEFATQWIGEGRLNDSKFITSVSPVSYIEKGIPPVITVHGDADPTVPYAQAVLLHQKLEAIKIPNRLVTIPGGDHGDFSKEQSVWAYQEVFSFLTRLGIN
jgi:acetyl esterase/lipase